MPKIDKHLLACGVVILVAFAAYFNGLDGEFVFDDIPLLSTDKFYVDNATSSIDCWKRCYWRKGMDIGQYRPVTLLSFFWNTWATGMFSPGFRVVNLLLHIIVSLLMLKLSLKLGLNLKTAFFAALLFAALPLHSEAVIPATGRAELLCAMFVLLGLLAHIKCFAVPIGVPLEDPETLVFKSTIKIVAAPLFLILACWSKENGIVLFPICVLYDLCFHFNFSGLAKQSPPLSSGLSDTGTREEVGTPLFVNFLVVNLF